MKEKLYTIPLNDAVNANEECPFCYIERALEQDLLDFVLGSCSSYMESDTRALTDRQGFCRTHFKKMYDYGNTLGNGWILKTHYQRVLKDLEKAMTSTEAVKMGFFDKRKTSLERQTAIGRWTIQEEDSCYICNKFEEEFPRYLDTFFYLYEKDPAFREKILASKGFCLPHFGNLCEHGTRVLSPQKQKEFFPPMFQLMTENMKRIYEDVSWLIEKFDYRNQDADWKTSRDAVPRGMQKLKGGYPSDPVYQQHK